MKRVIPLIIAALSTLSGCATYVSKQDFGDEALIPDDPTVAFITRGEYEDLLAARGLAIESPKSRSLQKPWVLGEKHPMGPDIRMWPEDLENLRVDGLLDCDLPVRQAVAAQADYLVVVNVHNYSSVNIPLGILSTVFSLTLVPVPGPGDAYMNYTVHASSEPDQVRDQGGVSAPYMTVRHVMDIPDYKQMESAQRAAHPLICNLAGRTLIDARDNYAFY